MSLVDLVENLEQKLDKQESDQGKLNQQFNFLISHITRSADKDKKYES